MPGDGTGRRLAVVGLPNRTPPEGWVDLGRLGRACLGCAGLWVPLQLPGGCDRSLEGDPSDHSHHTQLMEAPPNDVGAVDASAMMQPQPADPARDAPQPEEAAVAHFEGASGADDGMVAGCLDSESRKRGAEYSQVGGGRITMPLARLHGLGRTESPKAQSRPLVPPSCRATPTHPSARACRPISTPSSCSA